MKWARFKKMKPVRFQKQPTAVVRGRCCSRLLLFVVANMSTFVASDSVHSSSSLPNATSNVTVTTEKTVEERVQEFPEKVRESMQTYMEMKQAYLDGLNLFHAMWRPLIMQSEERNVRQHIPNCWTAKFVTYPEQYYGKLIQKKELWITNAVMDELLFHPKPLKIRIYDYQMNHIQRQLENGFLVKDIEYAKGVPHKRVYICPAKNDGDEPVYIETTETPQMWRIVWDTYSSALNVNELITEENVFRLIGEIEKAIASSMIKTS